MKNIVFHMLFGVIPITIMLFGIGVNTINHTIGGFIVFVGIITFPIFCIYGIYKYMKTKRKKKVRKYTWI